MESLLELLGDETAEPVAAGGTSHLSSAIRPKRLGRKAAARPADKKADHKNAS